MQVLNENENISNGTFWKSQKLVPRKRNQSILIPKIRSRKTTGTPSPKYEHRRASASLRNIQNIRICMGKKTYRFYLNSLWTGLWSSGELGRGESPPFPFPFLAIFFSKQRACSQAIFKRFSVYIKVYQGLVNPYIERKPFT